jgi:hypothetical protein
VPVASTTLLPLTKTAAAFVAGFGVGAVGGDKFVVGLVA